MTNFNERLKPDTKLQVIASNVPRISITSEALTKMFVYVDECSDEIGWLGTVEKVNNRTYIIHDVFLFEQDVHGATTEITPEGLSAFAEELLQQPDGMDVWNNMKLWGHSHVNMGVSPSGQDDKQMKEFAEVGHDWFIRLIANKKGEMKLDFFNYSMGITYLDVPWEELASDEEERLIEQILELQELLENQKVQRVSLYKEPIQKEMKEKVRKMQTVTTYQYGKAQNNYSNAYGRYVDGKWALWENEPPREEEKKTYQSLVAKKSTESTGTKTTTGIGDRKKKESDEERKVGRYMEEDVIQTDDDVIDMFSTRELWEFSYCTTLEEVEEDLEIMGYFNFFTVNDLERILRVAYKVKSPYEDYTY